LKRIVCASLYLSSVKYYERRIDTLNSDSKFFYCYSPKLKNELTLKGFKYLHTGIHFKTNRKFWVFENSEDFNIYFHSRPKY